MNKIIISEQLPTLIRLEREKKKRGKNNARSGYKVIAIMLSGDAHGKRRKIVYICLYIYIYISENVVKMTVIWHIIFTKINIL
jgi:hypothetical protein